MNILVVGNGFDLAHNLPTRYSDFLDFMVLCIKESYDWNRWDNQLLYDNWKFYYDHILNQLYKNGESNAKVKKLFDNNRDRIITFFSNTEQVRGYYKNNILRYCLYRYESRLSYPKGFNWIDIESELAEFIEIIRNLKYPPQKESSENYNKENGIFFSMSHQIHDEAGNQVNFCITNVEKKIKRNEIPNDMIKSFIFQTLFEELEIFDSLLIFYLQLVVDEFKKNPQKKFKINSDETGSIAVDYVLSFNYTDIAHMLYVPQYAPNFINGELESSHIVLGIENPALEKTEMYCEDNSCLFFKNIQRVRYNLKYEYTNWLTGCKAKQLFDGSKAAEKVNVHIIGHSLAISDKYILTDVIMNADNVYIYYYDSRLDKQDKITYLYKLLGDEVFSNHVNNDNAKPSISFVSQDTIMLNETVSKS